MAMLNLDRGYQLTTERAESSYGIPVLVAPNGTALGPNDICPAINGDDLGWLDAMYTAKQLVAGAVAERRELNQNPLVRAFLDSAI